MRRDTKRAKVTYVQKDANVFSEDSLLCEKSTIRACRNYNKNLIYASICAFFLLCGIDSAIIERLKTMRIAYMPLENGVPKRPFRPQA